MTTAAVDVDVVEAALHRDGYAIVTDVLSPAEVDEAARRLWAAHEEADRRGMRSLPGLDPNDRNIRVYDLVGIDPFFGDLLAHPVADAIVSAHLGASYIVSNFTANIARPGSGSMPVHSDQSFVAPEPWTEPWAINIIWCLTSLHADNGATLHLPGSHRITTRADVPAEPLASMVAFEAPAGAIVAMDGRMWHTSGANVTADEDRPLLFAYYTKQFLRPQWNFSASIPAEVQAQLPPTMRYRLGLERWLNTGAGLHEDDR